MSDDAFRNSSVHSQSKTALLCILQILLLSKAKGINKFKYDGRSNSGDLVDQQKHLGKFQKMDDKLMYKSARAKSSSG